MRVEEREKERRREEKRKRKRKRRKKRSRKRKRGKGRVIWGKDLSVRESQEGHPTLEKLLQLTTKKEA